MKLGMLPDGPMEAVAIALGLVPVPLGQTLPTLLMARSLMSATRFGLFEALADGPLPAAEVASRCGTHPRGTRILLDTMVSLGYVRLAGESTS